MTERAMEEPVPLELSSSYRSLLRDMHLALLSEIGARSIYDHLRRRIRDPELNSLLERLNESGKDSIQRLQDLIRGMGGRPRRTSFRRRTLARVLALTSRITGYRFVLRVCLNAEDTVGRWYAEYASFLARLGDSERALICEELCQIKRAHAQALGAWVSNMARRS